MKMLNKMVSCWLLKFVSQLGDSVLSLYGRIQIIKPKQIHNMRMRSEQMIQQQHASSCMSTPLVGSLQPFKFLHCTLFLWPGQFTAAGDVTDHGQKIYCKAQFQLWNHDLGPVMQHYTEAFRERLAVPSYCGPDMLWRVSLKIIWLQDRFPPRLLSSTSSAHSPGLGLLIFKFDFCCQITQIDFWDRFLENSLTTSAYQQL